MTIRTLKRKKWAFFGAMVGAVLFPILSYLLDASVQMLRVIIGV